ncbi:MAG TPA: zinc ribbon domain-containing protein, partial [Methylomirabilota bacterium]|nr:zinc ribbon domain-containing protein [Methylomirabilota bacterium]
MICPACTTENRQGAKFCDSCGASLPRACVDCGTALRANAKFCDECGRPVEISSAKYSAGVAATPSGIRVAPTTGA